MQWHIVAMGTQEDIAAIEARLAAAGITVKALLATADVASSQWVRWKQGARSPLRTTWARIVAAVDELAPMNVAPSKRTRSTVKG